MSDYNRGYTDGSNHKEWELKKQIKELESERDALQRFKDFVHKRLDDMGIPTHPDGEHSKAGCRIGDRLDIIHRLISRRPGRSISIDRLRDMALETFPEDGKATALNKMLALISRQPLEFFSVPSASDSEMAGLLDWIIKTGYWCEDYEDSPNCTWLHNSDKLHEEPLLSSQMVEKFRMSQPKKPTDQPIEK